MKLKQSIKVLTQVSENNPFNSSLLNLIFNR
jgi:hypothetical protein